MSNETLALAARVLSFLLLLWITWQAVQLRRLLPTTAWDMIAGGFVLFCILIGLRIFDLIGILTSVVVSTIAYLLLAVGFRKLRGDLMKSGARPLIRRRKP